jgi:hypothetical protein
VKEWYHITETSLEEDGKGEANIFIMGDWNGVVGDEA